MHLQWREAGAMGTNAIVGGGVPQALGFAFNQRRSGTDAVTVTYFGDGAINIGSVLESFNLAAAMKVPVCFFIENNHVRGVDAAFHLHRRDPGCPPAGWASTSPAGGWTGWIRSLCDWPCPRRSSHIRAGGGPVMIEAEVYRFFHQNGPFPGSAFGYRTRRRRTAGGPVTRWICCAGTSFAAA